MIQASIKIELKRARAAVKGQEGRRGGGGGEIKTRSDGDTARPRARITNLTSVVYKNKNQNESEINFHGKGTEAGREGGGFFLPTFFFIEVHASINS